MLVVCSVFRFCLHCFFVCRLRSSAVSGLLVMIDSGLMVDVVC